MAKSKKVSVDAKLDADARPKGGGRTRLLCLDDLDRRTTAFRETRDLIDRIESDLGGRDRVSTAKLELVEAAGGGRRGRRVGLLHLGQCRATALRNSRTRTRTTERHNTEPWAQCRQRPRGDAGRGFRNGRGRCACPAFDAMCRDATKRQFDMVMVWSVDRLGRSLKDLVGFLSELHALKVDLFLHRQGLDTTTPAGKAMFGRMGVFAEFEREMIQERVRAGLARARADGIELGRPPRSTQSLSARHRSCCEVAWAC
jgi:DNA invertase Pin-like site-specific DNA recombinase